MKTLKNYELRITNYKYFSAYLRLCVLIFLFSATGSAATLSEYHKKFHKAKESLDVLLFSDVEDSNKAENLAQERETLRDIRQKFPATEKVELQNTSVEVNNQWLLEGLRNFENERDSTKRSAILSEISERLGAIETKLNELEKATNANRTKDEDKQKLAEILKRPEYQKPLEKEESFFQIMWREFKEWLAKFFPNLNLNPAPQTGFGALSFLLQIVIYGLVLGLIGFLIYRFAPFLRKRFKQKEKKEKGVRVILGEMLAADETSDNLFAEAERLAREGNLRAAIRKGYIALLCELADRKIIGLAQHKTNRDYLRDVCGQQKLHQNMNRLTGSFERHWYGFDSADERDWEDFRHGYKRAISSER